MRQRIVFPSAISRARLLPHNFAKNELAERLSAEEVPIPAVNKCRAFLHGNSGSLFGVMISNDAGPKKSFEVRITLVIHELHLYIVISQTDPKLLCSTFVT